MGIGCNALERRGMRAVIWGFKGLTEDFGLPTQILDSLIDSADQFAGNREMLDYRPKFLFAKKSEFDLAVRTSALSAQLKNDLLIIGSTILNTVMAGIAPKQDNKKLEMLKDIGDAAAANFLSTNLIELNKGIQTPEGKKLEMLVDKYLDVLAAEFKLLERRR